MKPFESHPLVRGGQLQTLAAFLWSKAPAIAADEHMHVDVSGGDHIELAVNHPVGDVKGIIYLLHGLGGDANSAYKLRIAQKLLPHGFRVIRHNHRGNGEKIREVKGLYHSGSADDVLAGIKAVNQRWPGTPIAVVGFSLSGTMLLNLLGWKPEEIAKIPEIKGAMSVCSPLDLHASAWSLARKRNKHYDLFFAKTTLDQLIRRRYLQPSDLKKNFQKPTLRKVDEYVTAPYGGFRDAADYYDNCSPAKVLTQIRLPTLILAAGDDPVVPRDSVLKAEHSSSVTVRMERSGGHMGFLSRTLTPYKDYRWMDNFIVEWARNLLK